MAMIYFKGATAYECQIGRLWFRLPFWKYLRLGVMPSMGWGLVERRSTPNDVENIFDRLSLQRPKFVEDWKHTSRSAQEAVDDMVDVMEWLREEGKFEQADRLRTIAGRLARSVPPYPVFSGLDSPSLTRNLARTWPRQLTVKESKKLLSALRQITTTPVLSDAQRIAREALGDE
ncbi:hypothetical protein [Roseinatronobacter sp. NSM]|uniref:hypothetical protein n=1 Tax=Roseinatronobacter sp. NSM TaxID=3457785 RepID=UPI004035F6C2